MRTTLNLDERLLREAGQLSGIKEKTALIHRGLQSLVALEHARRLAALGATQKRLRVPRRRRSVRA
jgi:Arc/MetJ family transcription regulator